MTQLIPSASFVHFIEPLDLEEASNLRFTLECICYIYHLIWKELNYVINDHIDCVTGCPLMPTFCGELSFWSLWYLCLFIILLRLRLVVVEMKRLCKRKMSGEDSVLFQVALIVSWEATTYLWKAFKNQMRVLLFACITYLLTFSFIGICYLLVLLVFVREGIWTCNLSSLPISLQY